MNPETLAGWMPFINYGLVVLVSVVLTLIGRYVRDRWESPTEIVFFGYAATAALLGGYAVYRFASYGDTEAKNVDAIIAAGGGGPAMVKVLIGLMTCFPVLYFIGQIASGWYGHLTVDGAYWASTVLTKPKSSYGKAYALAKHNDILGAVRQFRAYFEEDPKEPSPLFYAAELLTQERYHREAVSEYLRIMNTFEKKETVWAGACYLLAELYSLHMGRPEDAKKLLRSLLDHTRQRHLRQMATDRIAALDASDGTAAAEKDTDSPKAKKAAAPFLP